MFFITQYFFLHTSTLRKLFFFSFRKSDTLKYQHLFIVKVSISLTQFRQYLHIQWKVAAVSRMIFRRNALVKWTWTLHLSVFCFVLAVKCGNEYLFYGSILKILSVKWIEVENVIFFRAACLKILGKVSLFLKLAVAKNYWKYKWFLLKWKYFEFWRIVLVHMNSSK